jgi:hypothetical protein
VTPTESLVRVLNSFCWPGMFLEDRLIYWPAGCLELQRVGDTRAGGGKHIPCIAVAPSLSSSSSSNVRGNQNSRNSAIDSAFIHSTSGNWMSCQINRRNLLSLPPIVYPRGPRTCSHDPQEGSRAHRKAHCGVWVGIPSLLVHMPHNNGHGRAGSHPLYEAPIATFLRKNWASCSTLHDDNMG